MAKRSKPIQQKVDLNLTSMLDVIFQLIVFFILVSNFTTSELPDLDPPDPEDSQAVDPQERNRVVVNIIPDGTTGRASRVRVGVRDIAPDNYRRLTELLESAHENNPEVEIDLRADQSLDYDQVQPVMNAVTAAGIGRINLVALTELGGGE